MAGARALWRATGMTDGDFGKPIIAIANADKILQMQRPIVLLHALGPLEEEGSKGLIIPIEIVLKVR